MLKYSHTPLATPSVTMPTPSATHSRDWETTPKRRRMPWWWLAIGFSSAVLCCARDGIPQRGANQPAMCLIAQHRLGGESEEPQATLHPMGRMY